MKPFRKTGRYGLTEARVRVSGRAAAAWLDANPSHIGPMGARIAEGVALASAAPEPHRRVISASLEFILLAEAFEGVDTEDFAAVAVRSVDAVREVTGDLLADAESVSIEVSG